MRSVDLLHVCFGGLGGHIAVVNTLTDQLRQGGISSGVIAVGASDLLVRDPGAWSGAEFIEFVPVTRRADLASMWTALRIARGIRARVVVMHTLRHTTPIALARLLTGQRLAIVTRESHGLPSRTRIVDVQSASSVAWGEAVVFLTEENRAGYPPRRLPLRGLRRQVVIPNGVDTSTYRPRSRWPLPDGHRPVLGMAARLVPGKDLDTLLRGLALLRVALGPHCPRLEIAGDGPLRHVAQATANDLGIADLVRFAGHIPPTGMPAFLDSLDIYVQLTDGEAFSTSILQACASGLAVITSDVPGVRDVFVDGDTAILLPPRTPTALAGAVIDLLAHDGALAAGLGERARQLAVTRYGADVMAGSYLHLFDEIDPNGPWRAAATRLGPPSTQD